LILENINSYKWSEIKFNMVKSLIKKLVDVDKNIKDPLEISKSKNLIISNYLENPLVVNAINNEESILEAYERYKIERMSIHASSSVKQFGVNLLKLIPGGQHFDAVGGTIAGYLDVELESYKIRIKK